MEVYTKESQRMRYRKNKTRLRILEKSSGNYSRMPWGQDVLQSMSQASPQSLCLRPRAGWWPVWAVAGTVSLSPRAGQCDAHQCSRGSQPLLRPSLCCPLLGP